MKEIPSQEHAVEFLRFNEHDLEKIERLSRLLLGQDKIVREDTEERESLILNDDDFKYLLKLSVKEEEESQERMRQRGKTSGNMGIDIFNTPFFSKEAVQARMEAAKEKLNALFPDKSMEIDELESRDLLGTFSSFCERYVNERCEAGSWKKLDALHEAAFETCDACFTTSQEGSATSSERSRQDSKYDSIYFLYALSNGTCISQRFKRNNIIKGGLSGVVHPVAPLALFAGRGIDGEKLKAGNYDSSEISTLPVQNFTLYEYFRQGFNAALRDPDQELQIPDSVNISGNSVEIACDMTPEGGVYSDIHEGTAVNRILK